MRTICMLIRQSLPPLARGGCRILQTGTKTYNPDRATVCFWHAPRWSIFLWGKFKELEIKVAMLFLWIFKRLMGCVRQLILTDFDYYIFYLLYFIVNFRYLLFCCKRTTSCMSVYLSISQIFLFNYLSVFLSTYLCTYLSIIIE